MEPQKGHDPTDTSRRVDIPNTEPIQTFRSRGQTPAQSMPLILVQQAECSTVYTAMPRFIATLRGGPVIITPPCNVQLAAPCTQHYIVGPRVFQPDVVSPPRELRAQGKVGTDCLATGPIKNAQKNTKKQCWLEWICACKRSVSTKFCHTEGSDHDPWMPHPRQRYCCTSGSIHWSSLVILQAQRHCPTSGPTHGRRMAQHHIRQQNNFLVQR